MGQQSPETAYSGAFPVVHRRARAKYPALSEDDQRLLPKLSRHHQDVLRASGTVEEIAKELGVPSGTVKSRLHRARKALAKQVLKASALAGNRPLSRS